jgi:hypothetical protein
MSRAPIAQDSGNSATPVSQPEEKTGDEQCERKPKECQNAMDEIACVIRQGTNSFICCFI